MLLSLSEWALQQAALVAAAAAASDVEGKRAWRVRAA
jgi:hypothetical protein